MALITYLILLIVFAISASTRGLPEENNFERVIILPPMPPRIYAQAPSGVLVTEVKVSNLSANNKEMPPFEFDTQKNLFTKPDLIAVNSSMPPCSPWFSILKIEMTDHEKFRIDTCTGKLSTARYVDKYIGEFYSVIIVAKDPKNVTLALRELVIEVTSYNSKPPHFTNSHFAKEILDTSPIGTLVYTLSATDDDNDAVNRELYFSMRKLSAQQKDPWFYPETSPLEINVTSGDIRISSPLTEHSSPLQYIVLVTDGGNPQRNTSSKFTLHIRNMSAPRNVRIVNSTESSIKVCWSPPLHGSPQGYLIKYNTIGHHGNIRGRRAGGTINRTIDELETRTDDPVHFQIMPQSLIDTTNVTQMPQLDEHEELFNFFALQFCADVENLAPLTNYGISVRAWAHPARISMARLPLTVLTRKKSCTSVRCLNGVCQEKKDSPGYKCICVTGYFGQHCDLLDHCLTDGSSACLNGGTCLRAPQREEGFECRCRTGYMGSRCEVLNSCLTPNNPCLNGGTCSSGQPGAFSCRCPRGFSGQTCEITELSYATTIIYPEHSSSWAPMNISGRRCKSEVTNLPEGTFEWPSTTVGNSVSLPCPYGFSNYFGHGDRSPEVRFHSREYGLENSAYDYNSDSQSGNFSRRSTRAILEPEPEIELHERSRSPRSTEFYPGAKRFCVEGLEGAAVWTSPVVRSCLTGEERARTILNQTSSSEVLNSSSIASSIKKITSLVGTALSDLKVAQNMVSALSNILEANQTTFDEASDQTEGQTSDSILSAINEFTANVPLEVGEKIKLRSKNLVLEAQVFDKNDLPPEVTFEPDAPEEVLNHVRKKRSVENQEKDNTWFRMPKSSLMDLVQEEPEKLDNDTDSNIRFQFISFKDDRLFRRRNNTDRLKHSVLSAIVGSKRAKVQKLDTPISYMIPIRNFDPSFQEPICVFWEQNEQKWSSEGLRTKQNENGEVFCESDHLTSFSVLLDPIGSPVISELKPVLSVITYIGLALSSVALIATIITFALFSLNRDRSGLIVMNLSMALLLLNCSFIGAQFVTSDVEGCYFFGALLHYAVTVSFAWMLIEAVNMYQLLVTVFPSSETHFMRKRVILGWGCPLILVAAALSWNKHVYFTEYQAICVISPYSAPAVYYTTYLGPVCAVLLVNVIVFMRVVRVLCQSRPNREVPVTLAQIRGAIAIVALLGITWLSGIIAIGHLRIISQILFCITTPFQGLIIFWVRVMQSPDAKMAWKTLVTTGSTRKRPKPISSVRTHSSSHHSSSLHTQSTGMTPPKSAFVSALVRRFSSGSPVSLGLIGSGKKKNRDSTSSDSSTKRLKKKLSNDIKKENPQKKPNIQPSVDNLYSRLTHHQKDNDVSLGNGNFNGIKPETPSIVKEKEYSNIESSESKRMEEEPLRDLQDMFNDHPFFDKSNGSDGDADKYQESIFSFMSVRKEEKRILLQDEYFTKKGSVSTSNLSPEKTLHCNAKGDLARSLESILPTENLMTLKLAENSPKKDEVSKNSALQSSHNKVSKKMSSCQNLSKTESFDNDLTTRSISDSEINDSTIDTNSSSLDLKYSRRNHHNNGFSNENHMTDVVPINDLKVTFNQRAASEQNLGPRGDDLTPFFRRSTSTAELDFMDHGMNPKMNLFSK